MLLILYPRSRDFCPQVCFCGVSTRMSYTWRLCEMSLQVRESGGGGSEAIATCGYAAALAMQHMSERPVFQFSDVYFKIN
ncbi:hypothetical protein CY34DRAFT_658727 [Suillus luteus UH-Slu-Lm8-n1]|uniref:Uncharacterized protein n=1 Tax=Suillus luteus UH-Slu-Lm8-n1 TaxID=930992 RepID=A0A0C9Z9D8_9AGAM|nr:hypothetical protein CY34DRAFT_658727 [Suillus luteus UH-Slu-Lm8-n1]